MTEVREKKEGYSSIMDWWRNEPEVFFKHVARKETNDCYFFLAVLFLRIIT